MIRPSRRRNFLSGFAVSLLTLLSLSFIGGVAHAVVVNNNNNAIAFSNNVEIGTNAAIGFTHRYSNAVTIGSQVVDAIFTVTDKSSGGGVSKVDESGAPSGATNAMINSTLSFAGSADYVTYRLDFVEGGTNTPITLQNVAINVGDIDVQQFAQFAGITDYRLSVANSSPSSTASVLTPQTNTGSIPAGSYRFQSTSAASTAVNEENWVEVRYAEVNSIEIVLGAIQSGGAYFSIDFQPASWPFNPAVTTPAPTSYTVTYDGNSHDSGAAPGATSGTGSQTIASNSGGLTKAGYTFSGWNTAANGSGATYAPGSTIIPINNVTLYAMWVAVSGYTLTYDPNTASGNAPSGTSGSGSITTAPTIGSLSKSGYTFAGWNTQPDGSGTTYQPGDALNLTSNLTLYAMWTPILAVTGLGTSSLVLLPLALSTLLFGITLMLYTRRFSLQSRTTFLD